MTIRVLVVDDQQLVRSGLRALVDAADDLVVVAEAGDGAQAVRAAMANRPDVVLMDIRMPGMDGIEATREITRSTEAAVVVLTTFDQDAYVFAAVRAGAAGFLLKDGDASELRAAIRTAASGDALMNPRSLRRLMAEFAATALPDPGVAADLGRCTPRELEVLAAVARGLSNREVADELCIGEATAKTHVGSLLAKLHCRDRAQLVVAAYESGLVRPGS